MIILRAWMWVVPIGLLAAAVIFGAIAAIDGRWPLFGVMVVIGLFSLGLLMLHWWVLYRFGGSQEQGASSQKADER